MITLIETIAEIAATQPDSLEVLQSIDLSLTVIMYILIGALAFKVGFYLRDLF